MTNSILDTLDSLGIQYTLHHHEPVFTVEEAATVESQVHAFHTKNLFLTDKKGNHYLACIGAHTRLRIKEFGGYYGIRDLSFGSSEAMQEQLHTTPGSVSIFGISYQTNTTLFLDPSLVDQPVIGRHPNDNSMTVVLSWQEIQKYLATFQVGYQIIETELL